MFDAARSHYTQTLADIRTAGLYKEERVIATPQGALIQTTEEREVLNFCANNYLGLSSHPAIVEAAKGVKARQSDDAHAHGGFDPHAWQDVANAKLYVANIRNALASADPAGREVYEANATAYLDRLDTLDREVRAAVAAIPPERRRIITTHDAFGYFKAAYGLDFVAPQGVSTEAEASAKDVARIIRQIKAEKIPAVFLENVSDPRLMDRIARETGARTGPKLYSDALSGPDGPAGTYIAMVRHNIRAFSEALSR